MTQLSPASKTEVMSAVMFATKTHYGQYRKGSGLPYIVHPISVLLQLRAWGIVDQTAWVAAALHDIVEDCPNITVADLTEMWGIDVGKIIDELTFIDNRNSGVSKSQQKDRYLSSFKSKSVKSLVIKLADRISNTLDFQQDSPDYAPKYWAKASELVAAFYARESEITEVFGSKTFDLMKKTVEDTKIAVNA